MKIRFFIILALIATAIVSCDKYVDIKTQGAATPNETINYRYLLNNTTALEQGPQIGDISSSDVEIVDGSNQQKDLTNSYYTYWKNSYTWQPNLYPIGQNQEDYNWDAMYNTIFYSNTVIQEAPGSTGGTSSEKAELVAEAKVHRADAYLMLMNTYAKPYNAARASSDLGVPLVLIETTTQKLTRSPSQIVYNQIIADLTQAIPSLPVTQPYTTLPSKASGYGELARCYLYMNNYAAANKYADSALAMRSTLDDLTAIDTVNTSTYPLRKNDPEILLSKVANGGVSGFPPTALRLSDDLLSILTTNDQRYKLFTTDAATITSEYTDVPGRYFFKDLAMYEPRNIGPSVPEMMLIKAEYYARNNDIANALLWINNLRKKRFKPAVYTPLTTASATDALTIVIQERRREFFCRMLPWWDMRRLNNETNFQQTYKRIWAGVTYTLAPGDNRYVFTIPAYQIQLNPEIQQNP